MPDYRQNLLRSGYPTRQPYASEDEFFRGNPQVTGMAAADRAVILNPYSGLTAQQQSAVALNEAARHRMMDTGRIYDFPITEQQRKFFAGTPYAAQPQMMRHTIAARAMTGDTSAGPYTPAQQAAAEGVLSGLLLNR
jgi:hypothetical protein